jgi:hypothetical protein
LARVGWVYVGGRAGNKPPQAEKVAITAACEKFDLSWHRHTSEWFCLFQRQSLAEALHLIESVPHFEPC